MTATGGTGDPKVSPKMTVELWIALGVGLTALSWHALGAWALLVFVGCTFVGFVQHGVRIQRERERASAQPAGEDSTSSTGSSSA